MPASLPPAGLAGATPARSPGQPAARWAHIRACLLDCRLVCCIYYSGLLFVCLNFVCLMSVWKLPQTTPIRTPTPLSVVDPPPILLPPSCPPSRCLSHSYIPRGQPPTDSGGGAGAGGSPAPAPQGHLHVGGWSSHGAHGVHCVAVHAWLIPHMPHFLALAHAHAHAGGTCTFAGMCARVCVCIRPLLLLWGVPPRTGLCALLCKD